uniref:Uncharacterized protein n=1 Tax=Nelumbo nucifera TaxID=4432 RepID=A0A822YCK1_NELNU|nr:TPA_asm: hypothetical protein HUJ06_030183 [Nelumbo nucifera]
MGCSSSLPESMSFGWLDGFSSKNVEATNSKNLQVKLVLLGDYGVRKSCIVLRFVHGQFDPSSKVIVRASFLSQTIALQDSTIVKFEIWDTTRQERYAALTPPLLPRSCSCSSCYWVKELQKHGSPNIVLALVGNKKNGMFFIETSTKIEDNINQLFEEIAKRLPCAPSS